MPPGARRGPQLAIVRTAWLFGPPGNDFPAKILAAAERARAAGEPLRVVGDEVGSPTYAPDLADAIVELLAGGTYAGLHHVVNGGAVSRAAWARAILAAARRGRPGHGGPARRAGRVRRPSRRGPSSPRPRCRRASRCARGRRPSPTTCRSSCAGGPRRRGRDGPARPARPPPAAVARSRASPGGAWPVTATSGAASASSGGRARSARWTRVLAGRPEPAFTQANLSTSSPGVLRGLHLHRRQLDHWVVTAGRALVALVDVRPLVAGTAGPPASSRFARLPGTPR